MTEIKRYSEIPEKCPFCEEGTRSSMVPAVDVTVYDHRLTARCKVDFDPEGDPESQPVRVFCSDCLKPLPLSEKLAESLILKTLL